MYTIESFNRLQAREQYAVLEDYGTFLDISLVKGEIQRSLFDLFGFYVVVRLDIPRNKLLGAKAFDISLLDPYLTGIDISPALSLQ
jgi:hypothetical protein